MWGGQGSIQTILMALCPTAAQPVTCSPLSLSLCLWGPDIPGLHLQGRALLSFQMVLVHQFSHTLDPMEGGLLTQPGQFNFLL